VKRLFWPCTKIKVGDGRRCRFWEDVWLGENPLANMFPRLYSISLDQHITVHQVFAAGISNLRFRRAIVGEKLVHWDNLKALCMNVTLNDNEDDALVWTLSTSGKFSVKSFYLAM
jgi:hypothetical protein